MIGSAAAAAGCRMPAPHAPRTHDDAQSALGAALDAATRLGATYADARVVRRRREHLATREEHVSEVGFSESYGIGVRVTRLVSARGRLAT